MWKSIFFSIVKNWMPTLGGLVTAAAPIALSLGYPDVAALCGVLGPILLGGSAKQSNVTGSPSAPSPGPSGSPGPMGPVGPVTSGEADNAND